MLGVALAHTRGDSMVVATVRLVIEGDERLRDLVERYYQGLHHCVWLAVHERPRGLGDMHRMCYRLLRERYALPSAHAVTCYREALAIYRSWSSLPRRMRGRYPVVRTRRMWLSRQGYKVDWEGMRVRIAGAGDYRIVGWPKNLWGYVESWELREARLVRRGGGFELHAVFARERREAGSTGRAVAVDVNLREVVAGDGEVFIRVPAPVDSAARKKWYAEFLQRKYSSPRYKAWLRPGVRRRIRLLGKRVRDILDTFAKTASKRIVDMALERGADTVVVEDLRGLRDAFSRLPKRIRRRVALMAYRRLLEWIRIRCERAGLRYVELDPRGTSSTCPRCGARLVQLPGRRVRCPRCGYEGDRDETAVLNLLKRYRASQTRRGGEGAPSPAT